MTTINTVDDFLQALDDNPAWRDAVRARLLGEDLLELPAKFNDFAERQQQTNERLEASIQRMDGTLEELRRMNANSEARIDRMDNTLEDLRRMNANAEARMNRMESDIGSVKGWFVLARLKDFVVDFIEVMNCELAHVLDVNELALMSKRIADATPDELRSFRRADMVMLAGDRAANGSPVYLAVEASYTGSKNDTDRAERNARFLTELTGIRAIPVIASVRNTREVAELIEGGNVRWYEIEERYIQAE